MADVASPDLELQDHRYFDGPTTPGELVTLRLAPALKYRVLTGRVLNTEGKLAKNLRLKAQIRNQTDDKDVIRERSFRTDGEGNFRLPLEAFECDGTTRTLTVVMRKTKRKPRRTASVDFSAPLQVGDNDVGDLVVKTPPLLA